MHLLVIRHAIAEDREEFAASGQDDSLRPLTGDGRRKMRNGAQAIRQLLPTLDRLATSPFTRAEQTAEIVAAMYGDLVEPQRIPELVPDAKPAALLRWLRALGPDVGTVGIVGHEPHLSRLVAWLLAARSTPLIELKKGSACLLRFDDEIGAGTATLLWALTPAQLRQLGGRE